jgi:hypothetical protein
MGTRVAGIDEQHDLFPLGKGEGGVPTHIERVVPHRAPTGHKQYRVMAAAHL